MKFLNIFFINMLILLYILIFKVCIKFFLNIYLNKLGIGDWGLGIGDWGLGFGANPP